MKTALVAGASGLVGSRLTTLLQESDQYGEIHLITRRPLAIGGERIREHVIDYEALRKGGSNAGKEIGPVDDVFCALGTTIGKAGSKKAFARVDHDLVIALGVLAIQLKASRFLVVSSLGADPESSRFYLRVKGDMEASLEDLDLKQLLIFRPSLLKGDRDEFRPGEVISNVALRLFAPVVPAKYLPVTDEVLARAMLCAASEAQEKLRVYESDEIRKIGV
jgi:uncharacterized protein YbjT (DUF2867 family)